MCTPRAFFLDGDEYRRWRRRPGAPQADEATNAGTLKIDIAGRRVHARFSGGSSAAPAHLEFALLASGLRSSVRAGENRGRELRHDFMVADLSRHSLKRDEDGWHVSFDLPAIDATSEPAVAAWVIDDRGSPIQATGGWL